MASSPTKRCSKLNLPTRATSENCAATRPTGSSFVDPGNLFNILDEINDVDTEGYVPDYLNQDWIERSFQQRYELMLKRREMAGIYRVVPGHRNWQIETAVWNLASFLHCDLETRLQRLGQFLNDFLNDFLYESLNFLYENLNFLYENLRFSLRKI